jgi:hypothetical protein
MGANRSPQKKAVFVVTSGRIAFNWKYFKSDPALGSFFERRIATAALERDEGGKWALVGQIQAASVHTISIGTPEGFFRKRAAYAYLSHKDRAVYAVDLVELEPAIADRLGFLFLRGFAQHRIETNKELEPGDLAALEAIVANRGERKSNRWANYYDLPGAHVDLNSS